MTQRNNQQLQLQLAQKLKTLRKEKGVSQQQVYNDTDVHVGRLETGKMNATINTVAILCDYFGLTLSEFFGDGFE
jgi:transcriptional regulator with XRE-family HTH domain